MIKAQGEAKSAELIGNAIKENQPLFNYVVLTLLVKWPVLLQIHPTRFSELRFTHVEQPGEPREKTSEEGMVIGLTREICTTY